jgi:spore maturation protein CgeB
VNADEIVSLYSRAKIVLGICNVGFQIKEVNLKTRDFDAISCGALVVSNACHEFNVNMTPGLHYIQYFEFPDLLQKIQYFLKHPSEARIIAEFGFNHGLKNHLWREHLKKVIYDIS